MLENKNLIEKIEIEGFTFYVKTEGEKVSLRINEVLNLLGIKKKPTDWLRTKKANEYLKAAEEFAGFNGLVHVVTGGKEQGTWFGHIVVIRDFIGCLDVNFDILTYEYPKSYKMTERQFYKFFRTNHFPIYVFMRLVIELHERFADTNLFKNTFQGMAPHFYCFDTSNYKKESQTK